MILFGHRFIKSESFYHVFDIDSISNTPPSSPIYLEFDEKNLDIIDHALRCSVKFALHVKDIKEIVYASSLGAAYIIVEKPLAKTAQNIAENYLFDSKILVFAQDENDIEELALLGIDGILFQEAVIKISS